MRAGKLTDLIVYRSRPTSKSLTGADVPGEPVIHATVYSEVRVAKGQRAEFEAANRLNTKIRYELKHRPVAGITEGMEAAWGNPERVLNVVSAPYTGQRAPYQIVTAEEQR